MYTLSIYRKIVDIGMENKRKKTVNYTSQKGGKKDRNDLHSNICVHLPPPSLPYAW